MKTDISPQICPIDYPTDKPRHVYVCENSPEGILSGVYDAWVSRYGHSHNYIQIADNLECNIFYEYINVETDYDKAVNIKFLTIFMSCFIPVFNHPIQTVQMIFTD